MPRVRPCGPLPLFAARITWIVSAASDSIAVATSSPDEAARPAARRSRRRDSDSAGSAEILSKAAASRWPPWPIRRSPPFVCRVAVDFSFGFAGLADAPVRLPGDLEPLSLVAARVMGIGTHHLDRQRGLTCLANGRGFPPDGPMGQPPDGE